jgi:hypothetical protein
MPSWTGCGRRVVAEKAEEGLERLVCLFGLAVGLGMEGCGKVGGSVEELLELGEEVGGEDQSSVGTNAGRETMMTDDCVGVHPGEGGSVKPCLLVGCKAGHFGEGVSEDLDAVVTTRFGQLDDSIHHDGFPRARRRHDRLEQAVGLCLRGFVSVAGFAAFGVGLDQVSVAREGERAAKEIVSLVLAAVAGHRRVMAGSDDVEAELMVVWDGDEAVGEEDCVGGVKGAKFEGFNSVLSARTIWMQEELDELIDVWIRNLHRTVEDRRCVGDI